MYTFTPEAWKKLLDEKVDAQFTDATKYKVTAYTFVKISGFSALDDKTKQSFAANAELTSSTGVDRTYIVEDLFSN
jgi:hypothetical protein